MFSEISKLPARKKLPYLSLGVYVFKDFQTHVFGHLITRVWICSLIGIKGHPRDPN